MGKCSTEKPSSAKFLPQNQAISQFMVHLNQLLTLARLYVKIKCWLQMFFHTKESKPSSNGEKLGLKTCREIWLYLTAIIFSLFLLRVWAKPLPRSAPLSLHASWLRKHSYIFLHARHIASLSKGFTSELCPSAVLCCFQLSRSLYSGATRRSSML